MEIRLYDKRLIDKKDLDSTKAIRLLDIWVYGPILIIAGLMPIMPKWMRVVLISLGILTFIYNGYYYLKYKDQDTIVK